jgi:ubiquinone/menaquinone biosynthesis C-methylase UbiE
MKGSNMAIIKPYRKEDEICIYLEDLSNEQKAEDEFFKSSVSESASAELYKSLLFKVQSLLFFEDIVQKHNIAFKGNLLELGGGYGYISAYIKRKYPDLTVIYSDISKEAVKKSKQYEDFFNVAIDEKWVTSAEDTPFSDSMFDNILFFASFHHVQHPQVVVKECARILKSNGRLFMLLEPSCPSFLKPLYALYVKREKIKEKFYTIKEYKTFFENAGLTFKHYSYKNYIYRWSERATLYYLFLNMVPNFITNIFPCTQVIIGLKM